MSIKLLNSSGNIKYSLKCVSSKPLLSYKRFNVCIIDENENAILKSMIHSGNYDEHHEFYGPIIGNVNRLLIAPEDDTWTLDNVKLEIDNDKSIEFECNGETDLYPIKEKIFDAKKKEDNDKEYLKLKTNILFNTVLLVSIGSIIDDKYSDPFIIGGVIGLIYIQLLQQEIDIIERSKNAHSGRLLITLFLASIFLYNSKQVIHDDYSVFLYGFLGFLMYRVGVLIALFQKN
jgi:hypothetical protein